MTRYEMRSRIATGGMGEVWRAEDSVLGREVAVKVLKSEFAGDATFRTRFETEARHAASLHHPNIATVFDYGENESEDGGAPRPYLVMELVEGRPLSDLIRPDRPMAPEKVRDLVSQAAGALAQAHAQGIVHRDVKPANMLVTPAGQVKVTDFGIARAADGVALTTTGEVVGTPYYLSPEQAQGRPATPASDVYALGVVLFECLTGARPFAHASGVATALAHVREPVPDLPADIPADLAEVTRRALAKDPADRYPDAAAMAAALGVPASSLTPVPAAAPVDQPTQVMAAETSVLPPVAPVTPVSPASYTPPRDDDPGRSRRSGLPRWWPVAAVLVLALVVAVVYLFSRGGADPTGPSAPSSSATTGATHQIRADDYVGRPVAEARDDLRRLGFDDVRTTTRSNPGSQDEGTVAAVSPTGKVRESSAITLVVWGAKPSPSESPSKTPSPSDTPSETPTATPSDTATPSPSDTPSARGTKKKHGKGSKQ